MIRFLDLKKVNALYAPQLQQAVNRTVESGWYLLGEQTEEFEKEYASFIGTRHAVGVGNGLDALKLMLSASIRLGILNPGDEVAVPANTYIATILAITESGLKPLLIEPDPDTFQISPESLQENITHATKALMLVHLYGKCSFNREIQEICSERDLIIFEDNAQAHGCTYNRHRTGSLSLAAAHSFYPRKNLGALGDAGAVTTDNDELAEMIRTLAFYGSRKKYVFTERGVNSRIDEINAAALRIKLPLLDRDNAIRRGIARIYISEISNPLVKVPGMDYLNNNVFHIFPIFSSSRDRLQTYLKENGIETIIHYPIPPHKQECYREWNDLSLPVTEKIHAQELSLPISQAMTETEAIQIAKAVNSFR